MTVLVVLIVIAIVVGVPALIDMVRRSDLRNMAVRNAVRRPLETALIIVGSGLGTAIIVAALMVGDTFEASILDFVRRGLGEIDLVAEVESSQDADALIMLIETDGPSSVDGALALRGVAVAIAHGSQDEPLSNLPVRPVEPQISVNAVDFDALDDFGSAPEVWGLAGVADPGLSGIVINQDLADDLVTGPGQTVTLFAPGRELELTVTEVVETVGLAGWSDAYVSAQLFDQLGVPDAISFNSVVVSIEGTLFDSAGPAAFEAVDRLQELVEASPNSERLLVEVPEESTLFDPIKQNVIEDAEEEDAELTTLFFVVGGFSVLAGVLLLINLFVMLSEERRPNLGVLRAIGWNRKTLRRAFRTEGLIYAVPAAVGGTVLGIGVGAVIIVLTRSILQGRNPDGDFQLITTVSSGSLLTAGLAGFVIAMLAIWFTSWRISLMNIVAAIRDIPAPPSTRSTAIRLLAAAICIPLGIAAFALGRPAANPYLTMLSLPLIVVGIALALRERVSSLTLSSIGGLAVIIWGLFIFEILPGDTEVEIEFFLVYGAIVVAGGVALATVSGTLFQRIAARSSAGGVAARLAMAYPTARVFRTSSSLAMYSLIIFSLAFMAVLAQGIDESSEEVITHSALGYDILVQSLNASPLDPALLSESDDIEFAAAVTRTGTQLTASFNPETATEPRGFRLTGADPSLARDGAPDLLQRDRRFATDVEAFQYVLSDNDAVLAPADIFDDSGTSPARIGDTLTIVETGDELEIVGLYGDDLTFPGIWVSQSVITELDPLAMATRLYVAVDRSADPEVVVDRIEAGFLANGAEAETFSSRVNRLLQARLGFFSLLRGYLLLGLIIGIGGLAVTLSRAVRERRRQIGMLRSMGFDSSGVGRWFLGEAAFISVMGIICGATLGVLSAYFLATRSGAIAGTESPFAIPWAVLVVLAIVPLAASGLAALVPAKRAAALRPSEALRLAD